MKSLINKDKLLEALVKRAEGFYYSEEILEYSIKEDKCKIEKDLLGNENTQRDPLKFDTEKKSGSKNTKNKNSLVYSSQTQEKLVGNDGIGVGNESKQGLELLKKKVTTHYIPPDMLAIKMLIENFGEKIKDDDDNLLSLSDDELYSLQENLIREIQQSMEENKNET